MKKAYKVKPLAPMTFKQIKNEIKDKYIFPIIYSRVEMEMYGINECKDQIEFCERYNYFKNSGQIIGRMKHINTYFFAGQDSKSIYQYEFTPDN